MLPTIQPGSRDDYARLARFHYRAGSPATCELVLRAVVDGELAGVLVVSRPVLNGPWRRGAWGEEFAGPGAAAGINSGVRTISRVIVDPRRRGGGIAGALVRAYLARPLTRRTEAIAAMGRACPFFERAGMRRVECPPSRRARNLLAALEAMGLPAWRLVHVEYAAAVLRDEPRLRPALLRWANDSRATRRLRAGDLTELAVMAAGSLAAPPVVYVSG